ncbi:MAG: CPBP family intramembrane metalloprotease [Pyrinomonadaceae bacterium]|nr:CPBP family intramembrane metalloprotease [Pyrinomonadaceae bacterium]
MENNEENTGEKHVEELLFDQENPHWNVLTAIAYWLFSIAAIVVTQAIATLAYANYTGISLADSLENPRVLLVAVWAVLPAHLITLAFGWMIVTRMGRHSFSKMVGMKWGGFRWWHVILILLGIFALFAGLISVFGEQKNDFDRLLESSRAAVYAVAVMATFSAPIVEEVIYRGVLYSSFKKTFNTVAAVVIVSTLFAAVHVPQYWGDFATIFSLLSLSVVLTLVRVWTGNLLPCIALHFVFNGLQTSLLVLQPWLEPYLEQPTATGLLQ